MGQIYVRPFLEASTCPHTFPSSLLTIHAPESPPIPKLPSTVQLAEKVLRPWILTSSIVLEMTPPARPLVLKMGETGQDTYG